MIKRLIKRFKQNVNGDILGTIIIGDSVITSLQLLGGYHKPGITKVGRLSLVGECDGKKVKVYSLHSPEQGELRKLVGDICKDKEYSFPKIVASNDHLVVEEWIYGESVSTLKGFKKKLALNSVYQFLNDRVDISIKLNKSQGRHENSFCYFNDYLISRLGPWINWSPVAAFVDGWRSDFNKIQDKIPLLLSHPDLASNNLIYNHNNHKTYFIDNELLGFGTGWILDHLNAKIDLTKDSSLKGIPEIDHFFLLKTWGLRRIGSAIDAGKFNEVVKLINECKEYE
jgi:hypothetical protein